MSDCHRYAVTIIGFVGSVFSPYYHWSGRLAPENHSALNVALYLPGGNRWAMTERGEKAVARSAEKFAIGPSAMRWEAGRLIVEFDETAIPFPPNSWAVKRMRGRVILTPKHCSPDRFAIDDKGRHVWWPVAPLARISVECDLIPDGGWEGAGYHDINWGDVPVEQDFIGWHWARGKTRDGDALIFYDARLRDGEDISLALRSDGESGFHPIAMPKPAKLKRGIWGVDQQIPCDAGAVPQFVRPLEDAPFYTRSIAKTHCEGENVQMIHETLDCDRLANPLVRLMLPFRMPRRAHWDQE